MKRAFGEGWRRENRYKVIGSAYECVLLGKKNLRSYPSPCLGLESRAMNWQRAGVRNQVGGESLITCLPPPAKAPNFCWKKLALSASLGGFKETEQRWVRGALKSHKILWLHSEGCYQRMEKCMGWEGCARGQSLRMRSRWCSGSVAPGCPCAQDPEAGQSPLALPDPGLQIQIWKDLRAHLQVPSPHWVYTNMPRPAICPDGSVRGSLPSRSAHHAPGGTVFDLCIGNIFCQFAFHFHNYVFWWEFFFDEAQSIFLCG